MNSFRRFQSEVSAWAGEQFPLMSEGSRVEKILDELVELEADPSNGEEMADIALVLLDHAEKANVDLFSEMKKKFEICKERSWGEADSRGVYHHESQK